MSRLTMPSGHAPTAAEWVQLLSYLQAPFIRKTIDEGVTSSTALQNDNELLLSVAASAEYEMLLGVVYTAGTAEKIKYGFTGPAGATLDWHMGGPANSVVATSGIAYYGPNNLAGSDAPGAAGTGSSMIARPYGLLRTGVTAGTLQFQFAQNFSGVNTTTVKAGSFMLLNRLS